MIYIISHIYAIYIKMCSIFSHRILPSGSWRQSRALSITYIVLGISCILQTNNLKEGSHAWQALEHSLNNV